MARREDHQQRSIHYATIIPSDTSTAKSATNGKSPHNSPAPRKQTELERAKALYVDFEDAFQDETTNHDYFGYQPHFNQSSSGRGTQENSSESADFFLQSIETVSEVKNTNFSPLMRYQASRESSRPSTPSDTPPFAPRSNHRAALPPNSSPSSNHHASNSNGIANLNRDLTNLNLVHSNDIDDSPAPFTPDALRIKIKQNKYDDSPVLSSQFKLILPQYFLVKYLGRTTCTQLWGSTAVRSPIDDMVHSARQLPSMNEMPTLEACVNTRGLTLTHRHSSTRSSSKHQSRNHSPDRHQHGLIPLEYISYVMHDLKYSKISACIVLRQSKTAAADPKATSDTVTECYAFLFQSKEHAHRFALSLAEAFNAQKRSSRGAKQNHDDKREERSPPRRSKHRSNYHHHERTRGKYDDSYLRDSEV